MSTSPGRNILYCDGQVKFGAGMTKCYGSFIGTGLDGRSLRKEARQKHGWRRVAPVVGEPALDLCPKGHDA